MTKNSTLAVLFALLLTTPTFAETHARMEKEILKVSVQGKNFPINLKDYGLKRPLIHIDDTVSLVFLIDSNGKALVINTKTQKVTKLVHALEGYPTAMTTIGPGVYLIGDSEGNVLNLRLDPKESQFTFGAKPLMSDWSLKVQEIRVSSDGKNILIHHAFNEPASVGYKLNDYLPGDDGAPGVIGFKKDETKPSGALKDMGYGKSELINDALAIEVQQSNFGSKHEDPRYQILTFFTLDEKGFKAVGQKSEFNVFAIADDFSKIVYSRQDKQGVYVIDYEKFKAVNTGGYETPLYKGGADFLAIQDNKVVLASADKSKVMMIGLDGTTQAHELEMGSLVRGLFLKEKKLAIIKENGEVEIIDLAKDFKTLEKFSLNTQLARNLRLEKNGEELSVLAKNGQRISLNFPSDCNHLFK